jgi:hypothetical protein
MQPFLPQVLLLILIKQRRHLRVDIPGMVQKAGKRGLQPDPCVLTRGVALPAVCAGCWRHCDGPAWAPLLHDLHPAGPLLGGDLPPGQAPTAAARQRAEAPAEQPDWRRSWAA